MVSQLRHTVEVSEEACEWTENYAKIDMIISAFFQSRDKAFVWAQGFSGTDVFSKTCLDYVYSCLLKHFWIHYEGFRRKKRDTANWACKRNQFNRQHGLQHRTESGTIVPAKTLGPACKGCRFKCDSKFTRQERQEMFDHYHSLDRAAQRSALISYRSKNPTTQARTRAPNFQWHIDGKRVCYAWMEQTFKLSRRTLRKVTPEDRRGTVFFILSHFASFFCFDLRPETLAFTLDILKTATPMMLWLSPLLIADSQR